MRIIIGSSSLIKIEAVREALAASGTEADVVGLEVPSGVAVQPVGESETLLGATNRARAAQSAVPGAWSVGIENGLFLKEGEWHDVAIVVLISPDGLILTGRSKTVIFPGPIVEEARRRGFAVTAGSILAETTGGDPADPHAVLTGGRTSRKTLLAETLTALFKEVRVMSQTHHRITIGNTFRDLLLSPVPSGVRVALFNLRGDHYLAEAAGKELAKLVPKNVRTLVMPAGKAENLLHVMGRETDMVTIVALKEVKPHTPAVYSVPVDSITTGKTQMLHLTAEDADWLKGTKVAIVDDVVSRGGTRAAMTKLMELAGAEVACTMCVFTEGEEKPDVISLGHLPYFPPA